MSEQFLRCIQEKHTSGSLKPNELDHSGLSLVHQAAKDGQLTCLKWLMKYGGDLEVRSSEDLTPAHYAAGQGHLQILQYLHERERESISIKGQNNVSPLYLAAQEGQLDCLIWLTKTSSVSPDMQTDTGMTPCHAASQEGRMECLRYLIKAAHAQIKTVDNCGCGILHYAAAEGHWKIVKWLINHCGIAVGEKDNSGARALHTAAYGGHDTVIQMLMKCDAVLDSTDYEGKTALDYAIANKHRSCANVIRNIMFRSPADLQNSKKVRFNELVYTYDIKTPRYKTTNGSNEKKNSSDYWDEVIQSQFDYWRNSPQLTKRQRQTKERRTFYKGRSKNLSNVENVENGQGEEISWSSEKLNIDPPDLLKHLNEKNLDGVNGTSCSEVPAVPVRNGLTGGGGGAPPVPARSSSINAAPPPLPARVSCNGHIPPIVPKRTGVPKFPLDSSQDSRHLESRGYKVGRTDDLNSTSKSTSVNQIDPPVENSTPTHSPLPIPFKGHRQNITQNPIYRSNEHVKYTYPKPPNTNSTTTSTYRRIDGSRNNVTRLSTSNNKVNSNSSNCYKPSSYLDYKSVHKVKLKDCETKLDSVSNGRTTTKFSSNASSSFDSHLHDIRISQFSDKSKIRLYSRNLTISKTKTSTWASIRSGVTSFFNSIRPKRDQIGRYTWSDSRFPQRADIFTRFSLPRKASKKEFDDLFNHSIEGSYILSKNSSFNSLNSTGRMVNLHTSLDKNQIGNPIGISPYDRFRPGGQKDSFSGIMDLSPGIPDSQNSFESFLMESTMPSATSTIRKVRKDRGDIIS